MNGAKSAFVSAVPVRVTAKEETMENDILISPTQAMQVMALCVMLRDGDIAFRADEREDEDNAKTVIMDVGQEIALQLGGA